MVSKLQVRELPSDLTIFKKKKTNLENRDETASANDTINATKALCTNMSINPPPAGPAKLKEDEVEPEATEGEPKPTSQLKDYYNPVLPEDDKPKKQSDVKTTIDLKHTEPKDNPSNAEVKNNNSLNNLNNSTFFCYMGCGSDHCLGLIL